MHELVRVIHNFAKDREESKDKRKRIRKVLQGIGGSDDDSTTKPAASKRARRVEVADHQKKPLPSTIHPKLNTKTIMIPGKLWPFVTEEHKKFILSYNQAVRHGEELPSSPDGVTVGPAKADGNNGMTALRGGDNTRRQRSIGKFMTTGEENKEASTKELLNDQVTDQDKDAVQAYEADPELDDISNGKEDSSNAKKSMKKIWFNLHNHRIQRVPGHTEIEIPGWLDSDDNSDNSNDNFSCY